MPFECFSSTFQGKFNFQGLFETVLYIQVLFKPVGTLAFDCPKEMLFSSKFSESFFSLIKTFHTFGVSSNSAAKFGQENL